MTVVPNPAAAMGDFLRVTRKGGQIIILNHVSHHRGPQAELER
jgi:hypothetical protein